MKHSKIIIRILVLVLAVCTVSFPVKAKEAKHRGVWLCFGDYRAAGLNDKNETDFTNNADKLFKMLNEYKINNVYFHVRAFDDAIYPSSIFTYSRYMSSRRLSYDPLKILVEKSHKYNIKFHAWINPYRITYEKIYNPAKQKTIDRIVDGVNEIVKNYNVDGIHFDDYFYPAKIKGQKYYKVSVKKRKKNVNKMISAVYSAVKEANPSCKFSISPAGNIEYAESIGCDFDTWLNKPGYVDYIIPQIYWSDSYYMNGHYMRCYTVRLRQWVTLCGGKKPMYIGLGLYKAGVGSSEDRGWKNSKTIIVNQIDSLNQYSSVGGFVLFSYQDFFKEGGKAEYANYIRKVSGLRIS